MSRLEKRQAGAVSVGVFGVVVLLGAVVLTVAELSGRLALAACMCGSAMLLVGVVLNSRVSNEMIHLGRR
ncbi:MAG: hypothetical protein HQ523_04225 [Lentisphaerae bacterium]|nr:hypothetical protein [Lentisphaerota bacterium]